MSHAKTDNYSSQEVGIESAIKQTTELIQWGEKIMKAYKVMLVAGLCLISLTVSFARDDLKLQKIELDIGSSIIVSPMMKTEVRCSGEGFSSSNGHAPVLNTFIQCSCGGTWGTQLIKTIIFANGTKETLNVANFSVDTKCQEQLGSCMKNEI